MWVAGCGSSRGDTAQGNLSPSGQGGYAVQFRAQDLAELFPDPLALPALKIDPELKRFTLFVYNADGVLVTHASSAYTTGSSYSETVNGIPVAPYDVIVAARDNNGNLLAALKARAVFPLVGGFQTLLPGLFSELQGFILPDET